MVFDVDVPHAYVYDLLGGVNMNLHTLILKNNECYKIGKAMTPKGVMFHSTGANNPNLKRYVGPDDGLLGHNANGNHWNQFRPDGRQVCVHAFIGKDKNGTIRTYQTLPWNMRGWHAGGSANNSYIGFEICEDGLTDATYFNKVYKEAVELAAYLCKQYNLDPSKDGVILDHSEGCKRGIASNHGDVKHWFSKHGKTMNDVRKDVKAAMTPTTNTGKTKFYRVISDSFTVRANAEAHLKKVESKGFRGFLDAYQKDGKTFLRVVVGSYTDKYNAEQQQKKLKAAGFNSFVDIFYK